MSQLTLVFKVGGAVGSNGEQPRSPARVGGALTVAAVLPLAAAVAAVGAMSSRRAAS